MMSLSELMDSARGLTNMYLAHEIAVDKDFMLERLAPEDQPSTSIEAQVRKVVHAAFWDVLASELTEDPPSYTMSLSLLSELRDGLIGLLLPSQTRIKENILERLDLELIGQQAENRVLDLAAYADYVIGLMAKLCAPVRDEEVASLQQRLDECQFRGQKGAQEDNAASSQASAPKVGLFVDLLRGLMKTLDLMKLDMANFTIQQARPMIVSQSVEYERTKFKEFLDKQEDGLASTRAWLKRHTPSDHEWQTSESDMRFKKLLAQRVLTEAFVELLEWDDYHLLPETLVMDFKRINSLRDMSERMAVSTAVILVAFSNVSGYVVPADANSLKEKVKKHVDILLEDFSEDSDLLKILPGVALQVAKDINDYLEAKGKDSLPEATCKTLQEQIEEMEDPNQRVRDLVQRRVVEFNKAAITTSRTAPLQIPPGLTLCQKELANMAGAFVRLVTYNRSVFGEFYAEIIENHVLFRPQELDSSLSKET